MMRTTTISASLAAIFLSGCAAGRNPDLQALIARQDSIDRRLDSILGRLNGVDSLRSDVRKIRILTDYLGNRMASQERAKNGAQLEKPKSIEQGKSFARGPEGAAVTMVTFSDFECPFCRKLGPVLDSFVLRHPDVRWVAKNFPLDMHPGARPAANAAIAAGRQGRYFEFQSKLNSPGVALTRSAFLALAKELRLDTLKYRTDLDDPRVWEPLLADEINQAQDLGVKGTPTVFLNGRQVRASSLSDLETAYSLATINKSISQEGN